MRFRPVILACALLALPALAAAADPGRLQLPDFPALGKRAAQAVVISLDSSLLHQASGFINESSGASSAEVTELLKGIRGIYVRSFSFAEPGEYSRADLGPVEAQLRAPGWQPVVSTHDVKQGKELEIYVRRSGHRTDGLAIIAADPRQLTIVNIVGPIDLARLARLQGQFGIPSVGIPLGAQMPSDPAAARTH
ncbi:MAG TPA: DUF4252 domain-containing protein [Steroidobacteraceae bacterium]|nr:DUF4252 domain-containing protein [Steroidobacteraceae bacterium]